MSAESAGQRKIAVVGGGLWGLALAAAAARAESDVLLVSRRGVENPPAGVRIVKELKQATEHARLILLAVPSSVIRTVARELGDHVDGSHYVIHGVRGLVHGSMGGNSPPDPFDDDELHTISDILRDETPLRRTGAIGGPALAPDLIAGRPSVMVVGSRYPEVTDAAIAALGSPTLRVYPTPDTRGLEWASALVGCLTIAVGYAQAMGMSAGIIAALITRAIGEASRIAAAAGGEERTLLGLGGYGDLLASIAQADRPEIIVGHALAKGMAPAEAAKAAELRVEALELIPRVAAWSVSANVRAPIFQALANGVVQGRAASSILHELMTLPVERA